MIQLHPSSVRWYEATLPINKIDPIWVDPLSIKPSTCNIMIGDNFIRTKRIHNNHAYFPTWEAAHEWLVKRHEQEWRHAKYLVDYHRSKLEEAKRLKKENV